MANVLTALAPVLFSAAQTVSAEPFGIVDGITTNFDNKGVAKGDSVIVPIAPIRAATDFTPGATAPQGDDSVAANVSVQITNIKQVSWNLTGEQMRSLDNGADGAEWAKQMVSQGMRSLRNLVEADAALQVKSGASRAYGTPGTTPFSGDLSALTNLYKILRDNGAPMADLQCVFNTAAGLNLRNQGIIQQAYMAGSDAERRTGILMRQFGFQLSESAGIALHTAGTATAATGTGVVSTGTLSGQDITIAGTSISTAPGDIVSFAGDSNKYVTGQTTVATGAKSGFLNRPGLRQAVSAAALTVGGSYTANLAFERSAVVGVFRPPLVPENPTIQQMQISDGSGLTYLLMDVAQWGQRSWVLALAYGTKVVQQEHVVLLLG